jgi:hypothetical protein
MINAESRWPGVSTSAIGLSLSAGRGQQRATSVSLAADASG